MTDPRLRGLVPSNLMLPCASTEAYISVPLVVDHDPVQVVAPAFGAVASALPAGGAELVRTYCEMWTQWLARAAAAEQAPR